METLQTGDGTGSSARACLSIRKAREGLQSVSVDGSTRVTLCHFFSVLRTRDDTLPGRGRLLEDREASIDLLPMSAQEISVVPISLNDTEERESSGPPHQIISCLYACLFPRRRWPFD